VNVATSNGLIENIVIVGNRVTVLKSGVQLWDGIRPQDVFSSANVTLLIDSLGQKKYQRNFRGRWLKARARRLRAVHILPGLRSRPNGNGERQQAVTNDA
jgi:hypothetical protein